MIRTGETERPDGLASVLRSALPSFARQLPPADKLSDSTSVAAEVNHGRWIVRCPWCPSAQLAYEGDRRFYCPHCLNAGAGGHWLRVLWPAPPLRADIEAVLLARPGPQNRNWTPSETVGQLHAENHEHGIH